MNKLKTLALVSLSLFCASALICTTRPFHVKAQGFENQYSKEKTVSLEQVKSVERYSILDNIKSGNIGENIEFKTETRIEELPYGTTEIGVDTIPKGTRELLVPGISGKAERTYLVKYVDGEKVEEAAYAENVIAQPVNETVNVGTGGVVYALDGTAYNYNYRIQMEATAYTYMPPWTTMTTATGETLRNGIVAVDPTVIPLHTKMFITGSVEYGLGQAEDTGGAIKGNIVDLAYMTYEECIQFGRRQMQVYILE